MTIYIDDIKNYSIIKSKAKRFGVNWCHLWTDNNVEELHKFAKNIGLKKEWFQNKINFPHYDLIPSKRKLAIKHGAVYIKLSEWHKLKIKIKMNKKIIFPANYNTIEGIKSSMSLYETFIKMLNDRHEAGYVRGEHLEEFIILGRFELDSCGNTNKIIRDFIPAEHIPELELVIEKYLFYNLIKEWQKKTHLMF